MREIRGEAKSIRALLQNERFGIDYFQREYQWGKEQVAAALDDLVGAFRKNQEQQGGSRHAADRRQYYFLGSIVISESAGRRLIADGQQRITTVTLLLIALHHRLPEGDQRTALRQLIYSYRSGRTSFNLDVVLHPAVPDPRIHETGYRVGAWRWPRGRFLYGAKSPFFSWTRSPASTPYCETGDSSGERAL